MSQYPKYGFFLFMKIIIVAILSNNVDLGIMWHMFLCVRLFVKVSIYRCPAYKLTV